MVTLRFPRVLRQQANGRLEVELAAANLNELLLKLEKEYPELYRCLCSESGKPRKHIHLFKGDGRQLSYAEAEVPLEPNDVVLVFQAVSGG